MITKENFKKGQKVALTVKYSGDDEQVLSFVKGHVANIFDDSIEIDLRNEDGYSVELYYFEILGVGVYI